MGNCQREKCMNGAVLLLGGSILLVIAYFTYGKYLARLFGIDKERKTPAHELRDDGDYVPAEAPVLFGHHFASIAGAGPIVGPVAAAASGQSLGGCAPQRLTVLADNAEGHRVDENRLQTSGDDAAAALNVFDWAAKSLKFFLVEVTPQRVRNLSRG